MTSQYKKCKTCINVKALTEFNKHGKYFQSSCKSCEKEYKKKYHENNPEYYKEYRKNNKDSLKDKRKEYEKNNKDSLKEKRKEYYQTNKERIRKNNKEYRKTRLLTDPYFRFTKNLKGRISKAFKAQSKKGKLKHVLNMVLILLQSTSTLENDQQTIIIWII
jgi:hypothetical protein